MESPRSVNMSELSGLVEIEPGYHVELPDCDHFILTAGANYPAAATRYDHPHVAARQDTVFHTRAYWPNGRKKWFPHAGRDFYFVIPRDRIELVFAKGYSFVPVIVSGQTWHLNVSGGTSNGWTDYVGQQCSIGIGCSKKQLNLLAQAALPPEEACRKVCLELTALKPTETAHFAELMASAICRDRLAEGHQVFFQNGYSFDDSRGPFYFESKMARRQAYLVHTQPGRGTCVRAPYKSIDWTATAAANGFPVQRPLLENRLNGGAEACAKVA